MEGHRIDNWLKLVCLYKHRSDATESCRGGHVRINEKRAKPASEVRVGDLIELTEQGYRRFVVLGLPGRSISKETARTMYRDETPARPPEVSRRIATRERGAGRPTKRERREMDRLKR
ncbi:MAG TPA: S4 domain-containing protein [Thermoanaerobaculia bacterium]